MSIFDLVTYFEDNSDNFPELAGVLSKNKEWILKLRNQRDNIVHYKSKVVVFEESDLSFAMLNAAGTEKTISTENGGQRIVTVPILEFVNSQMVALNDFLHSDLYSAIKSQISRNVDNFVEIGFDPKMSCIGIELFNYSGMLIAFRDKTLSRVLL